MGRGLIKGAALAALACGLLTTTGCDEANRRARAQRLEADAVAVSDAHAGEGGGLAPAPRRRPREDAPRPRVRADEPHGSGNPLRDPALER